MLLNRQVKDQRTRRRTPQRRQISPPILTVPWEDPGICFRDPEESSQRAVTIVVELRLQPLRSSRRKGDLSDRTWGLLATRL